MNVKRRSIESRRMNLEMVNQARSVETRSFRGGDEEKPEIAQRYQRSKDGRRVQLSCTAIGQRENYQTA